MKLWWHLTGFVFFAVLTGCYQSAPGETDSSAVSDDTGADTADGYGTTDSDKLPYDSSTQKDSETTMAADSETEPNSVVDSESDTLFTNRDSDECDDFGWDECLEASDKCGRMYLEAVHFMAEGGVSSSCETESLFYGCAPLKYCYGEYLLALDPNDRCWLMPTGCLPNEAGWRPAIDDDLCRPPIWAHSCLEAADTNP